MAATLHFRTRGPSFFNFSLRVCLSSAQRTFCAAAEAAPDRKAIKEANRANKEKGMKIQEEYKEAVRQLVSKAREERIENLRLRQAAEGEQQKLLESEKIAEKRIIEGVSAENEKLAALRKERLEIEAWNKAFYQMKKVAQSVKKAEELRKMRVAMVKEAIEESKEFVTPENLEEKIAFALENETNYNFALTPDGKKIHSTGPPGNVSTETPGPAAFVFSLTRKGRNMVREEIPREQSHEQEKDMTRN